MALPAANRSLFGGFPTQFQQYDADNWKLIVADCTRALSDPKLLPKHDVRKANLMRARAVAYFGLDDHDKALAEVDAAEAAGAALTQDPLYARSMGASLAMLRAAIWSAKGDLKKSLAFAQSAADARPYSRRYQSIVTRLLQGNPIDAIGDSLAFARLLPLLPEAAYEQFSYLASEGRFASAARQFERLKLEFPNQAGFGPYTVARSPNEGTLIRSIIASIDGAYAFAAMRDVDRAKKILADMEAGVAAALTMPPVVDDTSPAYMKPELESTLKPIIERRKLPVDARIAIVEKRGSDALKAIVGKALPVNAASVELLTILKDALPADQKALAPDPEAVKTSLAESRQRDGINASSLKQLLPAVETSENAADYKKANGSILPKLLNFGKGYAPSGFKSKQDETTGIITVEYLGSGASADAVEELTLLHAADLARQQGKAGLIVVDRRDFSRTLTTTVNGRPMSSRPAGFKTELDVRFVDPAALPADLALESDRVLRADKVYNELAQIYIPSS